MADSEDAVSEPEEPPPGQGVYGIGVTSDLVGTAIQNLRAYERAGIVNPARTPGGTRLYSPEDVARLRRVQALLAQGLNLAGVAQVLDLEDNNQHLRDRISTLTEQAGTSAQDGRGSSDHTPQTARPGKRR